MRYRERAPRPEWDERVECLWSMETETREAKQVVPDGCVDIVYSRALGLWVVGAMTKARTVIEPAHSLTAGIRFRPGMAHGCIGMPPGALTDNIIEWGGNKVRRLDECGSAAELMHELGGLLGRVQPRPDDVQLALGWVTLSHGVVCLDEVIRQTGLSARQFRRRCIEESGLSPKRLCRILRFRRARSMGLAAVNANWARVASECGYFDQSHLIRDFREFAGEQR